jgi:hypothetical protein
MGLFVSPFHRCFQQGFSFSGTAYYYAWRLSSKKPGKGKPCHDARRGQSLNNASVMATLADEVRGTVWPGLLTTPVSLQIREKIGTLVIKLLAQPEKAYAGKQTYAKGR